MRTWSASRWYCLIVAVFLGIRATTTLAAGASFTTPGTGWRATWQLLVVAILLAGLLAPRLTRPATAATGLIYLAATILEFFDGATLLGIVPVDMRDRFVHPLLAVAAALCLAVALRRTAPRVS